MTIHGTDGRGFRRSAHGTLASLLVDAVLSNATFRGARLSRSGEDFERELAEIVRTRLGGPSVRTSVEATWRPYPDAPVGGTVRIGEEPPRDADVRAATMTVASGLPAATDHSTNESLSDGYASVSRNVATAVVEGLFAERESELALRGSYPVDTLAVHRYRRAARLFGAEPIGLPEASTAAVNDRLIDALSEHVRADLAERFDSPRDAAGAVDTTDVRITVRTWSP